METYDFSKISGSDLLKLYQQYMASGPSDTKKIKDAKDFGLKETDGALPPEEEPELPQPELGDEIYLNPEDVEALEKALTELQELANDGSSSEKSLMNTVTGAGYTSSGNVMFSIAKLMQLIQECGKELKEAAREMRESALESEAAQMEAEANMQRLAGKYGMIIGLCFSGVQALVTIGSGLSSVSSMKSQINMMKTPELQNSVQTVNMLTKAQTIQGAVEQTTQIQNSLDINDNQAKQIKTDYFAEADQAKANYEAALQGNDPVAIDQARINARNAYDAGLAKYDQAVMEKQAKVEQLEARVNANDPANPNQQDVEDLAAAKADLAKMQEQRPYAEALQLEGKTRVSTKAQLENDLVSAKEKQQVLTNDITKSVDYRKKDITIRRMDMLYAFAQTLGGLSQALVGYFQGKYQAEGTEHGADAKKDEAEREAANDFVHSAQELISAVFKLALDIINVERDTNQQIIRG